MKPALPRDALTSAPLRPGGLAAAVRTTNAPTTTGIFHRIFETIFIRIAACLDLSGLAVFPYLARRQTSDESETERYLKPYTCRRGRIFFAKNGSGSAIKDTQMRVNDDLPATSPSAAKPRGS